MEFKIGDVVQLKSGGPKMTIDRIEYKGPIQNQSEPQFDDNVDDGIKPEINITNIRNVTCIWFTGDQATKVEFANFNPETIQKY